VDHYSSGEWITFRPARSALFPKSELHLVIQAGPERLLDEIERRSPDSVLASPGGRRYLRELVEALNAKLAPSG